MSHDATKTFAIMPNATRQSKRPNTAATWPLRFNNYSFGVRCFNTQRCSIVYDQHEFGKAERGSDGNIYDKPSEPPYAPNWKEDWSGSYRPYVYDPISPVEIKWTSLDGEAHEAAIDLEALFQDRLVLHSVPREEVPEGWLATCAVEPVSPHILVEVNDRTINVYMRALIYTKSEKIAGNPYSDFRDDLVLAGTNTY
ncbi:hypothetical protein [Cupriavidus necator]